MKILLTIISALLSLSVSYPFQDVSLKSGLVRPLGKLKKYGGPAVADLNGDGYPDLLFCHHGPKPIQLYFNNGNGTFTLSKFRQGGDTHALNPVRLSPRNRYMHFVLSRGGSYGKKPTPPIVFRITDNRNKVVEVTKHSPDFKHTRGRGRSMIFLSLRTAKENRGKPDAIMLNARTSHFVFELNKDNSFQQRNTSKEFLQSGSTFGAVTDINNDGKMEVVKLEQLSIWRLTSDFILKDISRKVLPREPIIDSATSFAEFDYDNDGDWDLIVTQSATNNLRWRKEKFPRTNILLNNVKGKFRSVTRFAGIPTFGKASESTGVTVGDFDNDGCVDIFIVRYYESPEMIFLKNLCNGKFKAVSHGLTREKGVPGTMATAVDYDLDGRLDLVIAEGDWDIEERGGNYRIIRNIMENGNSFLLVRVKNAPGFKCTSLHAVVTVVTTDGVKIMRRVGSPGTTVSVSYIETVHFGIGKRKSVRSIEVTWVDGSKLEKKNVSANSTLTFGVGY